MEWSSCEDDNDSKGDIGAILSDGIVERRFFPIRVLEMDGLGILLRFGILDSSFCRSWDFVTLETPGIDDGSEAIDDGSEAPALPP